MEHGKIRLLNTGSQDPEGITQVLVVSVGNRVYRVTNNGPEAGGASTMRIRVSRRVLWWSVDSVFDLRTGRSVDVYGSTISVLALDTLQQLGTYDTVDA